MKNAWFVDKIMGNEYLHFRNITRYEEITRIVYN